MTIPFVVLVAVGLIAAVRLMLYGVERQRPSEDSPRTYSALPAVIAAFGVTTGVVGYSLLRAGTSPTITTTIAFVLGGLAALVTVRLMARWWHVVPEHDIDDERYVLQGSLAKVVSEIEVDGVGAVALRSDSRQQPIPARGLAERRVEVGTEVVIERIEDGVAFVEEWEQVEKRL
ncbi:MAG TPA: hypothetical protein VIV65_00075 [Gemmatimonadaceae bacterium]|jgi:membrane protein implicated in regulation of membrane protease activity